MIYNQWDFVLIPFPFTDLSKTKKRPGLIVSPNEYNKSGDLVIAFVTSNLNAAPKLGDYKIRQWEKSGLPKPSLIRMKFATINQEIIVKRIGKLTPEDGLAFKKKLQIFFG
jgi:mRNA interferase MazF